MRQKRVQEQQAAGATRCGETRWKGRTAALVSLAACLAAAPLTGQTTPPAPPVILNTSATLSPAIKELRETLAGLTIKRWHAPDPVRTDAQSNADSLNRDLSDTLPPLLSAADAAPQSVAAAFAVYRNVAAAYDVLLRVSGTAELAAPDPEVQALTHALSSLQAAQKSLGENILAASRTEESSLTQLRAAASAPRTAATTTAAVPSRVVTDGPTGTTAARKKKAAASTPATPQP